MRALVVRSPWIERILDGNKTWEIRGSRTKVRESVGLIRSGSSTVVGVCDVVDCVPILTNEQFRENASKAGMKPNEAVLGYYKNTFAWVLANPRHLKAPVPFAYPNGAVVWVNLEERTEQCVRTASLWN